MEQDRVRELWNLSNNQYDRAFKHLNRRSSDTLLKSLNEEAEIPGFEERPLKFGQFVNKEFVVMMTDIRRSTQIIHSPNGLKNMFTIFYIYSAVVANIVDKYGGSATEFLGDGVLNLFETENNLKDILSKSYAASREILEARNLVINPFLTEKGMPNISYGIGIDYGITIVTRFGYKQDNDLKAFGTCVYDVSRLSKGENEVIISENAKKEWPTSPNGTLKFSERLIDNSKIGFLAFN